MRWPNSCEDRGDVSAAGTAARFQRKPRRRLAVKLITTGGGRGALPGNSLGRRLVLTSFGESHGKCVGAVLDGCPAGLELGEGDIQPMLDVRRPGQSAISTQRREQDRVEILSGTFRGRTTGAPIAMVIRNADARPSDYDELFRRPRPGHSDYAATAKYAGHNDVRGGGRFSGRLTAAHVMGGAVARKLLSERLGVKTHSYTHSIGRVSMRGRYGGDPDAAYSNDVRCPDAGAARLMRAAIVEARRAGDSLGGVVESVTTGLPVGVGEPVFASVESEMSRAFFSIPSVKGVEFGSGFAGARRRGSQNNDEYGYREGRVVTRTNRSGGALGGLSTGMPVTARIAFKPVSSIASPQKTVDLESGTEEVLRVKGRHDPCVVPRAPPVVDSLASLALADLALEGGFIGAVL